MKNNKLLKKNQEKQKEKHTCTQRERAKEVNRETDTDNCLYKLKK